MNPLTAETLTGTWSPLLLPINEDNSIDITDLGRQIELLIGHGVDGIYTNGTAGEFDGQTEEEFDRVSQQLSEACHGVGMPFQIGVSSTSAVVSRERLRRIVGLRPGAIQLILPDWSAPTNREAIAFLTAMAEETEGIGMVLYNPPSARRLLEPADLAILVEAVPSLIGIKVAGGDARWFSEMMRRVPELSIFVPGHLLAEGVRHGARGSYSNVACLHPGPAVEWYGRMIGGGIEAACELGVRIQGFMTEHLVPFLEQGYSNQAVDKLLACIGGWAPLTPRLKWPYEGVPPGEVDRLRPIAMKDLPEFFGEPDCGPGHQP